MTVDEKRWTGFWRQHDSALQSAALIHALSRTSFSDFLPSNNELHWRVITQLTDLMHNFCYHTRKSIEIAEEFYPGILKIARDQIIHYAENRLKLNENELEEIVLTDNSFWWVVGRIIHSKEALVIESRETVILGGPSGKTGSTMRPIAFGFRSDLDEHDVMHYVHIESFVNAFFYELNRLIENGIKQHVYGKEDWPKNSSS